MRPKQPTFGSLVLICKEPARSLAELSADAYADLQLAVQQIEATLRAVVDHQKINYLALMMVDPDVHFHVIPRYEGEREHDGRVYRDAGWPAMPNLSEVVELDMDAASRLADHLRREWRGAQ
ncbi:HIT family protein [Caulobacter sp. NIBR2454]|uniref:HIT family protein n=1 Tax=Caulobacter sp. NIBR2454 TaxID=3015996 RepID=UPI002FC2B7DA